MLRMREGENAVDVGKCEMESEEGVGPNRTIYTSHMMDVVCT
jgi:hypothetical protein